MTAKEREVARRWVEKAVAFYKMSGKRLALAEYTNPSGQFVQDDMYVFVLNPKGIMLAHGVNEKFVGDEFIDLQDHEGKSFIKEILDIANTEGSGWIDYKWYNPVTRKVLPKSVYFKKVDNLIICSGIYME